MPNRSERSFRVVVTRKWPVEVERELQARFDAVLNPDDRLFSARELRHALRTADAVCPTITDAINPDILAGIPIKAKILANYGVGCDHIDLDAARSKGLVVTNTPDVLTDDTADIAIALMLMVARRAGEGERLVRRKAWHGWTTDFMTGTKVSGKTLGLIGIGRIGRAVATRGRFGFGMNIAFYNPGRVEEHFITRHNAKVCDSVEEVLRVSDFVSLHCPGGGSNHHLLNEERLRCMRPEAILINTARGDVLDTNALITVLEEGAIAGAGLDVYENEPEVPEALLAMENVALLPHLGSATRETRIAMGMKVIENLQAFLEGKDPPDRIA